MFGYVMADPGELDPAAKRRYNAVYCGICRQLREQASQTARMGLSYDAAFLALLLTSLYEPEETESRRACALHPFRPKPWVDNAYVRYGAAMNLSLAYYNALDDYQDDGKLSAKWLAGLFGKAHPRIAEAYPRQCQAMADCIFRLRELETANCDNPDLPAGVFGELMGELLVYQEDLWAPTLRKMGNALGRYIYLADAAVDSRRDSKKGNYNPFLAMGQQECWSQWERYLVLSMARCTDYYERLPLVKDKKILDNILYSGIWVEYRRRQRALKVPQEEVYDR